ncbi:MAG: glycosyltransferase family 4 protein [Cyanobacteria bacterium J083]|nr:MAG: glycosyltransferase family 4 protein [Cyanobacteria bacterium J083]
MLSNKNTIIKHSIKQSSKSTLRVLFISHTYVVGINQGKLDAIASTNQAQVGLVAPEQWQAKGWKQIHRLEKFYASISYYSGKVWFNGRNGAYIYDPRLLLRAWQDFQPDIFQIEEEVFSLSTFQIALWARLTQTPLVVFVWENLLNRTLPLLRRWTCQFVLDTAQLIIAGNQDGKEILQKWGYQGKIEVIPQMGVDPHIFSPQLPQSQKTADFIIGYMGRTTYRKGLDILFSSIFQLRQQGYSFKAVVCGSGQDREALQQKAKDLEIDDVITWQEKVPHAQVPQAMAKFNVLVLPSRTVANWKEQFGHILIEAMSMGIPVIGSNCGEIPHVIGREDLIFPEEDSDSLTVILQRAMDEPQWLEQVSQYGINRVNQYYTHASIAHRLIEQWLELVK